MNNVGTPEIINGIVVDKFLIDRWPNEFSDCWIAITKNNNKDTTFHLIKNNRFNEGSIENTDHISDSICNITYNKFYRYTSIYTIDEYRNHGIAYLLARWVRTWVAKNLGIQIQMPYPQERVPQTQKFIEDWKERYNDITTKI
jgi:hypothetical protein